MKTLALAAALTLLCAGAAEAQGLTLTGLDGHSRTLDAAALAALPHVPVTLDDHGKLIAYSGVKLADLAVLSGAPGGEALRGPALADVVVVEAADGYRVVFALAELDPAFPGPLVVLADARDGKPLDPKEGPLRLIVQGDKRPARSERSVVRISIQPVPAAS